MNEGDTVTLMGTFQDIHPDPQVSFLWHVVSAPAGVTIPDATTQDFSFMATQPGLYTIEFSVDDGINPPVTLPTPLLITVDPVVPVVTPPDRQAAQAGVNTQLMLGSFSDPSPQNGPFTIVVNWATVPRKLSRKSRPARSARSTTSTPRPTPTIRTTSGRSWSSTRTA